ncbi:MAG: type II toxin-antitoxin system HicA family toxin [Phycisphaerae bacterium]|nr:type II toxin-antitoxin system HicA family toxin [Phycisphaerae bacterium]
MPRLSSLPTSRVIKAFERAGWRMRQGGKHMVLTKSGTAARLTIPRHRTVKQGLLIKQIKNAGLTVEEFLALYR